MIVISNTFSLKMLGYKGNSNNTSNKEYTIKVSDITVNEIKKLMETEEWASIVGHDSTANLFTRILGAPIFCNRANYIMSPEDILIVGLVNTFRLPEGKILNDDEIKDLEVDWKVVRLIS